MTLKEFTQARRIINHVNAAKCYDVPQCEDATCICHKPLNERES